MQADQQQRAELLPEKELRLSRVKEFIAGGMGRDEVFMRTAYDLYLTLQPAKPEGQSVPDPVSVEEDDQANTLLFVKAERLRVMRETSAVMHDPGANHAKINFALRFMTAATRLLNDLEKSVRQQRAPRGAAAEPVAEESWKGFTWEESLELQREAQNIVKLLQAREQSVEEARKNVPPAAPTASPPAAKPKFKPSPYPGLSQEEYDKGFQKFLADSRIKLDDEGMVVIDPAATRRNSWSPKDLRKETDFNPSAPSARKDVS